MSVGILILNNLDKLAILTHATLYWHTIGVVNIFRIKQLVFVPAGVILQHCRVVSRYPLDTPTSCQRNFIPVFIV